MEQGRIIHTFDAPEIIQNVLEDDDLHSEAFEMAGPAIASLGRTHGVSRVGEPVHFSDFGSCASSYAQSRRAETRKVDWLTQLAKFDEGAITGAFLGACLKVGIEHFDSKYHVELEYPVDYMSENGNRCVGHADAALFVLGGGHTTPLDVFELKKTMWPKPIEPPDKDRIDYVLQVCGYALGMKVPKGHVVTYAPAIPAWDRKEKKRITPIYLAQHNYSAQDWRRRIDAEIDRLTYAAASEDTACDTQVEWRGRLCRANICPFRDLLAEREKKRNGGDDE